MHHGDEDAAQRLLEEADQRPHDPGFQSMVDRNLVGYSGPSLVDYITQRVRRKSHVAWGEAIYLSNNCKKDHLEELQTFLQMTTDSRIRGVLEAAIIRARNR